MSEGKKVGVVVTCMDCRLHHPNAEQYAQLCDMLGVGDVYIDTEAGPDGAVCNDSDRCAGTIRNLSIIKEAKKPDVMAIAGHYDCAGHNVSDEQHDQDVVAAADVLSKELYGEAGKVVALIAYPDTSGEGPTWKLKRMNTAEAPEELIATTVV